MIHVFYECCLSICLDSFQWILLSGMLYNCSVKEVRYVFEALEYCTDDNIQSQTTATTTCGGLLGCTFNEVEDETFLFRKVEDFLNASRMIDITEILSAFQFGQKGLGLKNGIVVDKNTHHNDDERHEILKDYWKPTLHFKRGFCYTFEPKRDTKFPVLYHGTDYQNVVKMSKKEVQIHE